MSSRFPGKYFVLGGRILVQLCTTIRCRESLGRGMPQVLRCSLKRLGSTSNQKGMLGEEVGQEQKGLPMDLVVSIYSG